MEFLDGKNAARMVSEYIEREVQSFRRTSDKETNENAVAPEAREAFCRKPYYGINIAGMGFKCRPVVRQGMAG